MIRLKRNYFYAFLILALLLAARLNRMEISYVESVQLGSQEINQADGWHATVAANINKTPISLFVDGREIRPKSQGLYMTESIRLMVPSDVFRKAFSCVVNIYEDQGRILLEKKDLTVELFEGKPEMLVNQELSNLSAAIQFIDGVCYIPLEVAEKGLGYQVQWSVEENTATASNQMEDLGFLPYKYDYRSRGRAPMIKNQGNLGTCWAFAALTAMESLLEPRETIDFSRDHMSINNSFGLPQNDGGEYTMSMAYLLGWQGPVLAEGDPYGDGFSPEDLSPVKHVQEIQILPSKDYEKIKEAVYLYGGVQSSLYTSLKNEKSRSQYYNHETNSYCYIGTDKPNHDVVIVGWDDTYPKENFNLNLEGDGAFLCMNSWGDEFGDGGFFYISYYDTNIGIHNILYNGIEETTNYSKIYQSDLCGWIGQLGYGKEMAYFANVYQTEGRERLDAAGFYATGANTEYEVYVSRHVTDSESLNDRELVAKGRFVNAGYYTVPFQEGIELDAGERFSVIVSIQTPGAIHPIAIEYVSDQSKSNVDLTDGEGYISLRGRKWEYVEDTQSCNICLKAYTTDLM